MAKMFIFLVCMSLALFDSSQSASFQCEYITSGWGILGSVYYCSVQNSVSITSLDAVTVDDITGSHKPGFGNDKVEAFFIKSKGQLHYFPRGINKFFKNLKGVGFYSVGLKEIHKNDLKHFPKLLDLFLYINQIEVLEKNLFDFNPNLERIYLSVNKISQIHPNVFDKLTKLNTLYLGSNTCINMEAFKNPSEVQNVIKAAKIQCTNTEYLNLEQKVKTLEIESKNLNSENLKEKLQNLENKIKNSKFPNFFQEKLQDLKADQVKKAEEERLTTTTTTTTTPKPTTSTTEAAREAEDSKVQACTVFNAKIDDIATNLKDMMTHKGTDSNKTNEQSEQCSAIKERIANLTETMENLEIDVQNLKTASLRQIEKIENDLRTGHVGILRAVNVKADKLERKIEEQNQKIEEQNKKFEEKLAKIMKALKIDE